MRARTRRASMPRVGDRVLLLDCKEVRMQGKAFVGQTATVKVVAEDLQCHIAIDGSSSVLAVSAAAFLSSTSSLYGDLEIGAPAEHEDSMVAEQDSEEDMREKEETEKIPANHVYQEDLSTPSEKEDERYPKPNSSSLKKRKASRTMHASTAETDAIRPRKTNRRSKLGSEELKKQNRTASFIAKRKAELVSQMHEPGYKNSKRLLGLEDALELPEELTNMLTKQNAIDTSKHSCKRDLKDPFDRADFAAREPRCRIGNSLKILRGKIWRRGYIADYRDSDSKYLIISYQEDDASDSELEEEDDAARDRSWVDLYKHRFVEYTQVVWAKMNGWPHWPAQIYFEAKAEEVESGSESETFSVVFFGTHDRAIISQTKLLEYNTHKEEGSKARRMRKKLVEAMEEADAVVERRRFRRNISLDVGDALKTFQRGLSAQQWLGKRVWFWWPLDEMWYEGAVRRYDPRLKLHFVVYEDTVEWLDITSERVSLLRPFGESPNEIDLLQLRSSSNDAGLCFVCLRKNVDTETSLLTCCACDRRCHRRCVDASGRSDIELGAIRCPNCLHCQLCDDVRDFGEKLNCSVCDMRVHASCLREDLVSSSSSSDNLYICEECRICMSCKSRENVLKNSFTLCRVCDDQISAGDCCQECFCVFQQKEKRATCIQCLRSLHQGCMAGDTCRDCISLDLSKRLRPLVELLVNEDKSMYFLNPVSDLEAPHYSEIVRVPMSFSSIISKLDQQQYSRVDEFRDDINLLWKNAFAYNKPSSTVFKDAVRLQKIASASLEELDGVYAPAASTKSSIKNRTKNTSKQQLEVSPLVSSWLDYTAGLVGGQHLRQVDFCTLCLSSGLESDMLCCADCGECYHCFCLSSATNVQRREIERWRCPDCMVCEVCGEADQVDELLQCDVCDGGTHLRCHRPRLSRIPENGFRCQRCVECRCCGVTTPGKGPNARWMHDFTMCMACAQLYKQKKFCPVCDRVWRSTDSAPMVCCDACDMWVHNSCDAIDDHRYQDLTDNPMSKYYCPNCRSSTGVVPEEEPEAEAEAVIDKTSLRARDVAARSGDMSLPEVYKSMKSMLLAVQQKRRRSRRRLLLDTARHLAQGNNHVKVLPRKCAFSLTPVAPAAQRHLVPAPAVTGSSPVLLEAGALAPHRRCRLCHVGGVPTQCRLLRVGAFSWVHALCAIWSSEVLEPELGVLANLPRALVRGRETRCSSCGEFGATVNCCEPSCAAAFHYRCAQQTACVFLADCRTFCGAHRTHAQAQTPGEDTLGGQRIRRRLLTKAVPESDSLWPCEDGAVVLRIGALSVEALGSVELAERFHTRAHIFPVGFRSHRIYWSYMRAGRRTLYTCTISRRTQPLRPLFSIVAADDPDQERRISADSASKAWSSMVARLPSFMQRNSKRRRAPSGDTYAFGLSGPVFFGFGHPQVLPYIANLPGALECEHYTSVASACSSSGGGAANVSGSARTEIYERSRNETNGSSGGGGGSGNRRSASPAEERAAGEDAGEGALYRRMKLESRPVARRSNVHGIGLFATQKYAASDMVIEFVGELIRSQIADQREKLYARRGIASCFMFRIDEELVIDATTKGSVARFINHSCAANCTAKVLSFDGRNKKIVIVALRDIDIGEEICYDYKFTQEEQKLACHCKADACTGRLN